jgi:hypothetical protein
MYPHNCSMSFMQVVIIAERICCLSRRGRVFRACVKWSVCSSLICAKSNLAMVALAESEDWALELNDHKY